MILAILFFAGLGGILFNAWAFSLRMASQDQHSFRHAYWADVAMRTKLLEHKGKREQELHGQGVVSPSGRGAALLWEEAVDTFLKFVVEAPLFFVASSGSRLQHFYHLHSTTGGLPAPFLNGYMLFSYQDVSSYLVIPHAKGRLLGAQTVPDFCMGPETLIFLSCGPRHSQLRSLLISSIPGFQASPSSSFEVQWMGEPKVSVGPDDGLVADSVVERAVVATLFTQMFGVAPTSEQVDVFLGYFTWGASCLLGPSANTVTLGFAREKVSAIRQKVVEAIRDTPTIVALAEKIRHTNSLHDEGKTTKEKMDVEETVMQIVDGYLFAGMFGTTHLTLSTLHRIQSNPALYVPLFLEDPWSFLIEQARLDPPVTSVTALTERSESIRIGFGEVGPRGEHVSGGTEVFFPEGTPIQLAISTANRDISVFGESAHRFDPKRLNLDRALSWNGIGADVAAGIAPRGCPGRSLSIKVAETIIKHFLPSTSSPPSGKVAPGDCYDHSCVKPSEPIIYERLPVYPDWYDIFFAVISILIAVYLMGINPDDGPICGTWWFALLSYIVLLFGFISHSELVVHLSWVSFSFFLGIITILMNSQRFAVIGLFLSLCLGVTASLISFWIFVLSFSLGDYFTLGIFGIAGIFFLAQVGLFYLTSGLLSGFRFRLLLFSLAIVPLSLVPEIGPLLGLLAANTCLWEMRSVIPDLNNQFPLGVTWSSIHYSLPTFLKRVVRYAILFAVLFFIFQAYTGIQADARGQLCEDPNNPLCFNSKVTQLDTYTKYLYNGVIGAVRSSIDETPSGSSVSIPKRRVPLPVIETLPIPWYLPYEDENLPHIDFSKKVTNYLENAFLHSKVFFPLEDLNIDYDSVEEGRKTLRIAAGPLGEGVSEQELVSDEAMTRWAFYGLGAHLVERVPPRSIQNPIVINPKETYMVDLLWMKALDVRKGFRNFGAAAYFTEDLRISRIALPEGNFFPGDQGWEHAKFVWRSSLLTGVTFKDHLALTHLKLSSIVVQSSREDLSPNHPIRRLLTPFSYRTIEVNRGASSYLCAELGVLHRATALSVKGLLDGFKASLSLKIRPLLARQLSQGLDQVIPYVQDALDFQKIVQKFVRSYLDIYYPNSQSIYEDPSIGEFVTKIESFGLDLPAIRNDADLELLLVEYITMVTGFHHHVGTVTQYILDPRAACGKIRFNSTITDVQTSIQTLVIALFTSFKQPPLLSNFTHLLLHDQYLDQTTRIFDDFHNSLVELADIIDQRNKQRLYPVNSFNPRHLLSAVSI